MSFLIAQQTIATCDPVFSVTDPKVDARLEQADAYQRVTSIPVADPVLDLGRRSLRSWYASPWPIVTAQVLEHIPFQEMEEVVVHDAELHVGRRGFAGFKVLHFRRIASVIRLSGSQIRWDSSRPGHATSIRKLQPDEQKLAELEKAGVRAFRLKEHPATHLVHASLITPAVTQALQRSVRFYPIERWHSRIASRDRSLRIAC